MGRSPCCDENSGLKKGPWTPEEDHKLATHIQKHGHGSWRALPKLAGLNRCGKSCRLRWTNYLRPDIKRGKFSQEEEQTILNLHSVLGNKWSAIASHLPGRTDNEIKNFWNTHLKKKLIQMGFDPMTHRPRTDIFSSLPHLIALANLKDFVDQHSSFSSSSSSSSSWESHAAKLQTEAVQLARLQYLQFLLQPPMDNQSALNSLPYSLQSSAVDDSLSLPFSHLPELQAPCSFQTPMPSSNKENGEVLNDFGSVISNQGELVNSLNNSPWFPATSSTPSPPPLAVPQLPEAACSTTVTNFNQGDNFCSGGSSSCGGGGGTSFWPDLLFDDPLFQEIA